MAADHPVSRFMALVDPSTIKKDRCWLWIGGNKGNGYGSFNLAGKTVPAHRAVSLRSIWKAVRIEGQGGKALSHYAKAQPQRVIAFMQALADEDVKAGVRSIPGFDVIEGRVV